MIFLNKFSFISLFAIFTLFYGCNSQNSAVLIENSKNNKSQNDTNENIEFEEMRRVNANIGLKEITLFNNFQEILELYQQLENPKYSKSYPIPDLENDETLIVLKPELKNIKYGDFEITSIKKNGDSVFINYKEIENREYAQNKWTNPILIIKISDKFKTIQLISK